MLLFKRVVNGEEKSFFACSACRDRKDCSFFLWAEEKVTTNKKSAWDLERKRLIPKINHAKLYKKFVMLLEKSTEQRAFCHTCNSLLLSFETTTKHVGHDIILGISEHLLTHPSEVMGLSHLHEPEFLKSRIAKYLTLLWLLGYLFVPKFPKFDF
jgi:hypothetical protein